MHKKTGPISVMQVVDYLAGGGQERVAVNLANGLLKAGYETHLLATREQGLLAKNIAEKVRFWCANRTRRWDIPGIKRIVHYIDKNKIDIVHTHGYGSAFLIRVVLCFCKHKPLHVVHYHHGPAVGDKRIAFTAKLMLRNIDAYIAVSEPLKKEAKRILSLPEQRCIYLKNGIEIFPPHPRWDGDPTVVQVANFRYPKDHPTAIKTASLVRRSIPSLNWILVGSIPDPPDDYVTEVRHMIDSMNLHDCVTIMGVCADVRNLLRKAHVGVLTSVQEGFPMSILEYMAEQLPVVITETGQGPAVVRKANAGFVVEPQNPEKLATKILGLLKSRDLAYQLGQNGRNEVITHYSVDAMVRELTQLYKRILLP